MFTVIEKNLLGLQIAKFDTIEVLDSQKHFTKSIAKMCKYNDFTW